MESVGLLFYILYYPCCVLKWKVLVCFSIYCISPAVYGNGKG